MARRPPEEVINTMLARTSHARLQAIQRRLKLYTITDALDVVLAEYEAKHPKE